MHHVVMLVSAAAVTATEAAATTHHDGSHGDCAASASSARLRHAVHPSSSTSAPVASGLAGVSPSASLRRSSRVDASSSHAPPVLPPPRVLSFVSEPLVAAAAPCGGYRRDWLATLAAPPPFSSSSEVTKALPIEPESWRWAARV